MKRCSSLGLMLVFWIATGCSESSSKGDAAKADTHGHGLEASTVDAGGAREAGSLDAGSREAAGKGEARPLEAAIACTTGGPACPGNLSCLCCGSIGPKAICLCSEACTTSNLCKSTGLPLCNVPTGGDAGICTPNGFNCCWFCK
jgi:hypothetical protein